MVLLSTIQQAKLLSQDTGKSEFINGLQKPKTSPQSERSTIGYTKEWWVVVGSEAKNSLLPDPEGQLYVQTVTSSNPKGHQWVNNKTGSRDHIEE